MRVAYFLQTVRKLDARLGMVAQGTDFRDFFRSARYIGLEKLTALNVSRSFRTVCLTSAPLETRGSAIF